MTDKENHSVKINHNKTKQKYLIMTSLGAFFEWYDFCLYFVLGSIIAKNFFPADHHNIQLLAYYGIFAAGYLFRPLGGLFFGRYADKAGRKNSLLLSITLMMIPAFMMTFIPTYHSIGFWAPVILLLLRCLQGFSMGGEYTGILTLIFEKTSPQRRGLSTSIIGTITTLGQSLSTLVILLLHMCLSTSLMASVGWRIAFFIGFLCMLIVYFCQNQVSESHLFELEKKKGTLLRKPITYALKNYRNNIVITFLLTGTIGAVFSMYYVFYPNYMVHHHRLTAHAMYISVLIASIGYGVSSILGGWLSDKWGYQQTLYGMLSLMLITVYPLTHWMLTINFCFFLTVILSLLAITTSAFVVYINDLFPVHCRASGVYVGYNFGNALFCGFTPSICLLLMNVSNSTTVLTSYLAVCIVITILCMLKASQPTQYAHGAVEQAG